MKVYVNYNDRRWKKFKIDFEKIASAAGPRTSNAEVSIILTDDDEIHKLNRQYRNIDKPTNVLSFELGDAELLGDIYISLDTVMREAHAMGISVADHTAHMVVHGVLHLQGYDHINDADAEKMEQCETKILKSFGIKNPYATDTCTYSDFYSVKSKWLNRFGTSVLLVVLGGISALGFAPFDMWYMTLIGIGGAYWLLTRKQNKIGFWRAWVRAAPFGAAYAIAMFGWALHSIYVVPELTQQFAIWTIPGALGLCIAGAVVFGLPFACTVRARAVDAARPFVFAGFWTLVLWLREWAFTGFPWNPIANIAMPMPYLSNSMSVWGALGLTFVIIGFVAGCVEILRRQKRAMCWITWLTFVLLIVIGVFLGDKNIHSMSMPADNINIIRIVQPAKNQSEKMDYAAQTDRVSRAENIVRDLAYLARSEGGDVDLIVFPETTYPFVVTSDDIMPLAKMVDKDIVVGAISYENGAVYNSLIYAGADGQIIDRYYKSHLVPFGEYAPLGGLLPSPSNLARGMGVQTITADLRAGKFTFAPAVCYEIIFSDSLTCGADVPDAIINITNDTWFGKTPGVYQHLDMVRRYAIESGLPIVRANYSGISAFVAPDGSVMSEIGVGQRGTLDGYVWGAHQTPYRRIGRDAWMIIILAFACIGAIIVSRRKDG